MKLFFFGCSCVAGVAGPVDAFEVEDVDVDG